MPADEGYFLDEEGNVNVNSYIDVYNKIFRKGTPWILFSNGTIVVPADRSDKNKFIDISIALLKKYTNWKPGNPQADFVIFELNHEALKGYLIKFRDPIFIYVAPLKNPGPQNVLAGIVARAIMTMDASSLKPVAISGKLILDAGR